MYNLRTFGNDIRDLPTPKGFEWTRDIQQYRDTLSKKEFMEQSLKILESQSANKYLLENKKLYDKWDNCQIMVIQCLQFLNERPEVFLPIPKFDDTYDTTKHLILELAEMAQMYGGEKPGKKYPKLLSEQ